MEEWVRDGSTVRLKLWGNLAWFSHSFHGPRFSTARFRGSFLERTSAAVEAAHHMRAVSDRYGSVQVVNGYGASGQRAPKA